MNPVTRILTCLLALGLGCSTAPAQTPAGIAGGSFKPGSPMATPAISTPAVTPDWGKQLLGRWQSSEQDKDSGVTTVTEIEFLSDGRYQTRIRSQGFEPVRKPGAGRYRVEKGDRGGFTLAVSRELSDPESDKAEANESQRIVALDADTLQAADGSVVRRAK